MFTFTKRARRFCFREVFISSTRLACQLYPSFSQPLGTGCEFSMSGAEAVFRCFGVSEGKKEPHAKATARRRLAKLQPKQRVTAEFRGSGADGAVVAIEKADGSFAFKPFGKPGEYKWVAQLKPEQAQRAAEQFASELSRVGLTESEWLRLMSK